MTLNDLVSTPVKIMVNNKTIFSLRFKFYVLSAFEYIENINLSLQKDL